MGKEPGLALAKTKLARPPPCSSPQRLGSFPRSSGASSSLGPILTEPDCATGAVFTYILASSLLGLFLQPTRDIFLFPTRNLPRLQCDGKVCKSDLNRTECSFPPPGPPHLISQEGPSDPKSSSQPGGLWPRLQRLCAFFPRD